MRVTELNVMSLPISCVTSLCNVIIKFKWTCIISWQKLFWKLPFIIRNTPLPLDINTLTAVWKVLMFPPVLLLFWLADSHLPSATSSRKSIQKIASEQNLLDTLTQRVSTGFVAKWKGMKLNKLILLFGSQPQCLSLLFNVTLEGRRRMMREACGGEAKPGRQLSSLDMTLSRPWGYQQCRDSPRREIDKKREERREEDKKTKERLKGKEDRHTEAREGEDIQLEGNTTQKERHVSSVCACVSGGGASTCCSTWNLLIYFKYLLLMLCRFNFTQHNSTALEQMCPRQHHLVLQLLSASHIRPSLHILRHLHSSTPSLSLPCTPYFFFGGRWGFITPISFRCSF